MFNNIEQLEKEIAEFQSNLASSNELMQIMKVIASSVAKQNTALQEQLRTVEKNVGDASAVISGDCSTVLRGVTELKDVHSAYVDVLNGAVSEIVSLPDKIEENNTELIKKALTKLIDIQSLYAKTLEASNADFAEKLEKALENLKFPEMPKMPEIPPFPEFPPLPEFPEMPDLSGIVGKLEAISSEVSGLNREIESWRNWESQGKQEDREQYANRQQEIEQIAKTNADKIDAITKSLQDLSQKLEKVSVKLDVQNFSEDSPRSAGGSGALIPLYIGLAGVIGLLVFGFFLR
jgi:chromosome segregation ATPase